MRKYCFREKISLIYIFIIKKIEKKLSGKNPAKDKNKNAYYWYM